MHLIPKRSSLVTQTVEILKRGLRAGLWRDILPGELTLCARLQVSRVTLRGALARLQAEGWLSAGQGRRRVINRQLISRARGVPSTQVILLSPSPLKSLPSSVIFWVDSLRDHLASAGYHLEFLESHIAFSKHPERAIESMVHELRPAGWVLYLSNENQQRWFSERSLPCVVTGSCHPGMRLPSVDIDYAATCGHAVGLLAARGRRRLALLMPRSGQAGNLESERGFHAGVARAAGLSGEVAHHDGSVRGICNTIDRLLRANPPVTGLLVAKPAHVVTAMTHLLRRGARVPRDVSLISRDDDPFLEHLVPVVTRYHADPVIFARRISRLVLDVVRARARPRGESRFMPALVPGETLG